MDLSTLTTLATEFANNPLFEVILGVVGTLLGSSILLFFRARTAMKKLKLAEYQLRQQEDSNTFASLDRSRDEAERLLEQREARLSEIEETLKRLEKDKKDIPKDIGRLNTRIGQLRAEKSALEDEKRAIPNEVLGLTTEYKNLQDLIGRTKGYVRHVTGKIAELNRSE